MGLPAGRIALAPYLVDAYFGRSPVSQPHLRFLSEDVGWEGLAQLAWDACELSQKLCIQISSKGSIDRVATLCVVTQAADPFRSRSSVTHYGNGGSA